MRRALPFAMLLPVLAVPALLHAQSDTARTLPYRVTKVDTAAVSPLEPALMLPGRVPGAAAVPDPLAVGALPFVVLRPEALTLGQHPLVVVDGLVAPSGFSYLNPRDIATVTVMRSAAAAARYGVRGGAGVIEITTKLASSSPRWSFGLRTEAAATDVERTLRPASQTWLLLDRERRFCVTGPDFCSNSVDWAVEAARINSDPSGLLLPATFLLNSSNLTPPALARTFQSAAWPGTQYNSLRRGSEAALLSFTDLDASGRIGPVGVFTSLSLLSDPSTLRFAGSYERLTGRVNLQASLGRWSLAWNSHLSRVEDDDRADHVFWGQLAGEPALSDVLARDTLGSLYRRTNVVGGVGGSFQLNPMANMQFLVDQPSLKRLGTVAMAGFAASSWLDLGASLSMDHLTLERTFDQGARQDVSENVLAAAARATARWAPRQDLATEWQLQWLYDRDYQDAVDQAPGFVATNVQRQELYSLLGGATVSFRDRYVLDALVRRDRIPSGPSETSARAGLAWQVSREPWWSAPAGLNRLTVRAAHGTAGGLPKVSRLYETGANYALIGPGGRVTETEIGAELELFRSVSLSLTYAAADADAMMPVPTPGPVGQMYTATNVGQLDTRTWEVGLDLPLIRKPGAGWTWRLGYDRVTSRFGSMSVPPFRYGGAGTGAPFLALPGEPLGAFYGVEFITSCSQLPDHSPFGGSDFRAQCGGPTSPFQVNSDGLVVWTGGFGVDQGIARNLWGTTIGGLPLGSTSPNAPWGRVIGWGMPITIRDTLCLASPQGSCGSMQLPLGGALPDWRYSVSTTARWRRLSLYALLDGAVGGKVWNQTRHFQYLTLLTPDADQAGRSPGEAKPIGYYWRASPPDNSAGIGGLHDILSPNNWFVESASFAKLRELSVSFDVGPVAGFGDWTLTLVARNLFTLTGYHGLDPESVQPLLSGTDMTPYPVRRTLGGSFAVRF